MTTQEMIDVMREFNGGKAIDFRCKGASESSWTPAPMPCWNWQRYDYRVKREPREFFINVYHPAQSLNIHNNRQCADMVGYGRIECIHVREVLE